MPKTYPVDFQSWSGFSRWLPRLVTGSRGQLFCLWKRTFVCLYLPLASAVLVCYLWYLTCLYWVLGRHFRCNHSGFCMFLSPLALWYTSVGNFSCFSRSSYDMSFVARRCTFSICGLHTALAYSSCGRTNALNKKKKEKKKHFFVKMGECSSDHTHGLVCFIYFALNMGVEDEIRVNSHSEILHFVHTFQAIYFFLRC